MNAPIVYLNFSMKLNNTFGTETILIGNYVAILSFLNIDSLKNVILQNTRFVLKK